MKLSTAVYTAHRGYSWSNAVEGVSAATLGSFCRFISAARGDFPDPMSVEVGLVSDGETVGAFTIQNVPKWDSEQRASDYGAFAFFPVAQAEAIDFIDLLNNDFFWTPTRTPQTALEYAGGRSSPVPATAVRDLRDHQNCLLRDPRAIGAVLGQVGAKSDRWICLLGAENILRIECDRWN